VMGQGALARADVQAWKQVRDPVATANLYADKGWLAEWRPILERSKRQNLLFLAYSTGAHRYFPTVHSPEIWFTLLGQLLPGDKARVLAQIDAADVVVLDPTSPEAVVFVDKDIQRHLAAFCWRPATSNFQVLVRTPEAADRPCTTGK